jgi:transcriptional regulator with XRE-family HTH domain
LTPARRQAQESHVLARDERDLRGRKADAAPATVDWANWMRGLGQSKRRVRELLGLSQEQLARLAGVSQGAVSRLESGRALATPLVVVMKINAALRRAMAGIDPALLSEEARRLRDAEDRVAPDGTRFEDVPLLKDPHLEELVQVYRTVPERRRQKLVAVARAAAAALNEG